MVGRFLSVINMSVTHSLHYTLLNCGGVISVSNCLWHSLCIIFCCSAVVRSNCRPERDCSAHWCNVCRKCCSTCMFERCNVLLSHSCMINLAPFVSESSLQRNGSELLGERVVCTWWLAKCSLSFKSQRHITAVASCSNKRTAKVFFWALGATGVIEN